MNKKHTSLCMSMSVSNVLYSHTSQTDNIPTNLKKEEMLAQRSTLGAFL